MKDLPPHMIIELRNFFEQYTKLENKKVIVEDFLGKDMASKIILESLDAYKVKFGR